MQLLGTSLLCKVIVVYGNNWSNTINYGLSWIKRV